MSEKKEEAFLDWSSLKGLLSIAKSYDIVHHARKIFDYRLVEEIRYYLNGNETKLRSKYTEEDALYDATRISRSVVVRAISLRNVKALSFYENENISPILRFYSLLEISFLFHGCYILNDIATNSDFWHCVGSAEIDNKTFLSFHLLNYTYHMGKNLTNSDTFSSNLSGVMGMGKGEAFYEESKVLETRDFMNVFVSKIRALLTGPIFDSQFRSFYDKYSAVAKAIEPNPAPDGLLVYLSRIMATNWVGSDPLAVLKLRSLVGED